MTLSEKMPSSDPLAPAAARPGNPAPTHTPAGESSAASGPQPDPNAGKTFKPVAPRAAAKKHSGPGRPRKDPKAPGDGAGGSAPARPGNPDVVTVDAAKKLGQMAGYLVGSIECLACRIDLMQGLAIWKFTDLEKDLYAEPGARVLNKYAPEWWVEYQDEIDLAMALTPIFVSRLYMTAMIKYPHLAEKIAGILAGQAQQDSTIKPGPELVPDQPAPAETPVAEPARTTFADLPHEAMPRELVTQ